MVETLDPVITGILANLGTDAIKQFVVLAHKKLKKIKSEIPYEHLNNNPDKDMVINILASAQYVEAKEVKDIFDNLLLATLDKRKSCHVHRAFVEIAKQLSPLDARILMEINNPTILLHCSRRTNSVSDNIPLMDIYISENHPEYDRDISISIGNLSRLGIIYIPNRNMGTVRFDVDQSLVSRFKETDYFKSMYKDEVLTHVDVASYKAYITEFGLTFRQLALGM